jgi:hypothetical protein
MIAVMRFAATLAMVPLSVPAQASRDSAGVLIQENARPPGATGKDFPSAPTRASCSATPLIRPIGFGRSPESWC